jgi:hypothetical protein
MKMQACNLLVLCMAMVVYVLFKLNNSLFGAFEIDLQHLTVKPKAEFIKNPRYSKRRGNPRLKL